MLFLNNLLGYAVIYTGISFFVRLFIYKFFKSDDFFKVTNKFFIAFLFTFNVPT